MVIYWLYNILWWLFLPFIILYRILKDRRNEDGLSRFKERLGLTKPPKFIKNGILIHAVSLGEVRAITPLVEALLLKHPNIPITMSCMTLTGRAQIKASFEGRVQHTFLPFDHYLCVKLFMHHFKPRTIIVMETEIWPNLLMQAKRKQINIYLINARLSPNSFKQYQKIKGTLNVLLAQVHVLTQSDLDQSRFLQLGANPDYVQCTGNLKYDMPQSITSKPSELLHLLKECTKNRKIWVMSSTHYGEDTIALSTFIRLKKIHPELLLILVPRHPERFESVFLEISKLSLTVLKRTHLMDTADVNQEKLHPITQDVLLVDSIGELLDFYAIAHIVCVGGSFVPVGGHNILEPAFLRKPIITGPSQYNFLEISQNFECNAGLIICDSLSLFEHINTLLSDQALADLLANNAYQTVLLHQGALQKTLSILETDF